MEMLSVKLFNNLNKILNRKINKVSDKKVKEGVENTLDNYKRTLTILEKYDRGEIPTPEILARYSSMRKYLRDLQGASKGKKNIISAS